jgi:hypothetical protein
LSCSWRAAFVVALRRPGGSNPPGADIARIQLRFVDGHVIEDDQPTTSRHDRRWPQARPEHQQPLASPSRHPSPTAAPASAEVPSPYGLAPFDAGGSPCRAATYHVNR